MPSGLDKAVLQCIADELRSRRQPQLLLDVSAVRLDCADAEEELRGDLGIRVAECDQAKDLDLAHAEVGGRAFVDEPPRKPCAKPRVEVRLVPGAQPGR